MFACYWVVFLDRHAVWVVASVLSGHICVARTRGGAELDDRPVLLPGHLELHTLGLYFGNHRVDASLVNHL